MRLKAVKLKNFRGYRGEVTITFDDLTALIGRNDVGKSSVLDALAIFFDLKLVKFDSSDRCVRDEDSEVRIGCVFTELPESLVLDANAETSLTNEYLLNEDGDLEIHRVWNIVNGRKSESIVAVALHPRAEKVRGLLLKKNEELKQLASDLGVGLDGVDRRSNPALRQAIWSSCANLHLGRVEIPLDSKTGDVRKIWQKIQKELPTFALFRADRPSSDQDPEVQDPMKLAVKEALNDVADELERIKDKVRETALDVARRTLEKLQEIAPELARELQPNFNSDPKWEGIFKLTLTSDEQIPINKRGSGVRRLILLSFFRAEAERRRQEDGKQTIIYAIEEPETSQHPDNQRMLIRALRDLADEEGCQVIITTHVPALAGLVPRRGIRHITVDGNGVRRVKIPDDDGLRQIAGDLGVLPSIDDRQIHVFVCVEGPTDVKFLVNMAEALRSHGLEIISLKDDPRVIVLPLGGGTLQDWVTEHYLRRMGVPEVHIYDRDNDNNPKYKKFCDAVNSRADKSVAFLTEKREIENYLHPDAIKEAFREHLDSLVCVEITDECDVEAEVSKVLGGRRKVNRRSIKRWLSEDAARYMTPERLKERNGLEEVMKWFNAIADVVGGIQGNPTASGGASPS